MECIQNVVQTHVKYWKSLKVISEWQLRSFFSQSADGESLGEREEWKDDSEDIVGRDTPTDHEPLKRDEPQVSECVCVCVFESLPAKEVGRERVHCTLNQWKKFLFSYFLFVCLFVSLDSSICVRYICSIQNNDIQNWSCNIVTVPIYVYESLLLLLFLCWLSGEFLVWSLYEHRFWLCYVIRIAILWWGYR